MRFKLDSYHQYYLPQPVPDSGNNVSRDTPVVLQTFDTLLSFGEIEQTDFVFDDGIFSMKHESYLTFCIRIRHPYQNR